MGLLTDIEPNRLRQTGWAVIFAPNVDPVVRSALEPLLQHRRGETSQYYRELEYRAGDTARSFLSRHGVGLNQILPKSVPFYLLIVGSPADIPYRFQQQLDVNYAVGRLYFDDAEAYYQYAINVVESELGRSEQRRRVAMFAPRVADDAHTAIATNELVSPMIEELHGHLREWEISAALGSQATKERMRSILIGQDPVALLFAASHGVMVPETHPLFAATHGALVCQDWEGRRADGGDVLGGSFGAADIDARGDISRPRGMIAMLWSSFSAGSGAVEVRPNTPPPTARVARLPQALLAAPRGGMLAVYGFVDRMLGFSSPGLAAMDRYREAVSRAIRMITTGARAGLAAQAFDEAYAELTVTLGDAHEKARYGQDVAPTELVGLWAAANDMRNIVLLGDPAVRLPAGVPVTR